MRVPNAILFAIILSMLPAVISAAERNVSISIIPRGDWSYNALAMLASRGHAAGLPARYFHGDRLFTRMEMAELVASIASGDDLAFSDRVALKALALELRAELFGVGVSETQYNQIVDVPEPESAPVWTGSLRGRFVSNGKDDDYSLYELATLAPVGPRSFLAAAYTNEARDFRLTPEVFPKVDIASYKYLSGRLQFEAGRNYLRWGPGYSGSMILSDNSPAFDMLRFRRDIKFPLLGKLLVDQFAARFQEVGNSYYMLGRRYEKTLSPQWNIALNETAKTRQSPNPSVMVLPLYLYQHLFIDIDPEFNAVYSLDATFTSGRKLQAYAEFVVDDMTAPSFLGAGFDRPRKTGYLLGVYLPDPVKTGRSSLRAEYITVNPGTYELTRPQFPDLAYTQSDLVMGHPIGSNGNALFLRADHWLSSKAQLIVEYLSRSPRDRSAANAQDFSRLDAYVAYDVRPWASLTARYVKLRDSGTDNVLTLGASLTY